MKWIWQRPDWPDFRYNERTFEARELEFRINSARLTAGKGFIMKRRQQPACLMR